MSVDEIFKSIILIPEIELVLKIGAMYLTVALVLSTIERIKNEL